MDFWLGLFIGCFGAIFGNTLISIQYKDVMCSGVPVVVKTADTIRTFSCTVELKSKENK